MQTLMAYALRAASNSRRMWTISTITAIKWIPVVRTARATGTKYLQINVPYTDCTRRLDNKCGTFMGARRKPPPLEEFHSGEVIHGGGTSGTPHTRGPVWPAALRPARAPAAVRVSGARQTNRTSPSRKPGLNPLDSKCNYSVTSNNTKLVHWPLMSGLLHLVQRGGASVGCGPAQSPPRRNSPPINGHCTNHRTAI